MKCTTKGVTLVTLECSYEQPHKHRAWAWDALDAISPELAELCSNDPKKAYDLVRGEEDNNDN